MWSYRDLCNLGGLDLYEAVHNRPCEVASVRVGNRINLGRTA